MRNDVRIKCATITNLLLNEKKPDRDIRLILNMAIKPYFDKKVLFIAIWLFHGH